MKQFALVLVLVLALSSGAMAAQTRECKAGDDDTFKITVPEGWNVQDIENGCAVVKADNSEFISVAYYRTSLRPVPFAEQLASKLKAKPEFHKRDEDYADFDVVLDGQKINVSVTNSSDDDEVQVTMQKGDSDTLDEIFDSLEF